MQDVDSQERVFELLPAARQRIQQELAKSIVGQDEVIEQLMIALLSGGHGLLTGAPGLAKTLLIKSLAKTCDLTFRRIQFTPDLMPADITGTEILEEDEHGRRRLRFVRGPIFAQVVLADEINRTPPKTQAALLEAMQEHQVTAAGERHHLEEPFFVLATRNPIEMDGTYPLPEAQLDRFMFNIVLDYLPEDEEVSVVIRTTSATPEPIQPVLSGDEVREIHRVVRQVPVAEEVARYAVRLAALSRPQQANAPEFVREYVDWGVGLRGAQHLVLAAKARALLHGRCHVSPDDIRMLALPALRHRLVLNYKADAEGIDADALIRRLLEAVPAEV